MSHPSLRRDRGVTLIELMVTITVVALLMMLAVPSFGSASKVSRERSAVQKLAQDFAWARGAAGAANASILNVAGVTSTGAPTAVAFTVGTNCAWTTSVNGTNDANHSGVMATGTTCPSTQTIFNFTPQGMVNTAGTIAYVGASGQGYTLQVLISGMMLRLNGGQS